jgi:uncharacterized protein (DUF58 family)
LSPPDSSPSHADGAAQADLAELLAEVRHIEVQSKRLVASALAGGYRSVFRGSGLEFDEVREYVSGDDPRTVDWNVTARAGKPFIKKFVDERELTVMFLIDLSPSMDHGFGHHTLRQMAARICGCLALSAVRNNDKIGMLGFSSQMDKYVPARKGSRHALSIIRDCLALKGSGSESRLNAALDYAGSVLRGHSTVFLLSDFCADGWQQSLALCAKRHDLIAVRLLPPDFEQLPQGLMKVVDPETGQMHWLDGSSLAMQQEYRQRMQRWQDHVAHQLAAANVDCMDVAVPRERDPDAVSRPIHRFFRMREQRGGRG